VHVDKARHIGIFRNDVLDQCRAMRMSACHAAITTRGQPSSSGQAANAQRHTPAARQAGLRYPRGEQKRSGRDTLVRVS
jgi:hypothetical protein